MGADGLQVSTDQLGVTTAGWQGLSAQLTAAAAPPAPGPPFQPTTAAVNAVNGAVGAATAAFAARAETTAAGVTTAAGDYTSREATSAGEMAAVTGVTVV